MLCPSELGTWPMCMVGMSFSAALLGQGAEVDSVLAGAERAATIHSQNLMVCRFMGSLKRRDLGMQVDIAQKSEVVSQDELLCRLRHDRALAWSFRDATTTRPAGPLSIGLHPLTVPVGSSPRPGPPGSAQFGSS